MTRQTHKIPLAEIKYPAPIGEAELVRSAEHLRQQVIADAFARFSRRRRTHHKPAVQQFVGAYSVVSSGTGSSI